MSVMNTEVTKEIKVHALLGNAWHEVKESRFNKVMNEVEHLLATGFWVPSEWVTAFERKQRSDRYDK